MLIRTIIITSGRPRDLDQSQIRRSAYPGSEYKKKKQKKKSPSRISVPGDYPLLANPYRAQPHASSTRVTL